MLPRACQRIVNIGMGSHRLRRFAYAPLACIVLGPWWPHMFFAFLAVLVGVVHHRGYGATVARLTPDQKVGSSNLSALILRGQKARQDMSPESVIPTIVVQVLLRLHKFWKACRFAGRCWEARCTRKTVARLVCLCWDAVGAYSRPPPKSQATRIHVSRLLQVSVQSDVLMHRIEGWSPAGNNPFALLHPCPCAQKKDYSPRTELLQLLVPKMKACSPQAGLRLY